MSEQAKRTPGPWRWDEFVGGEDQVKRLQAVGLEPTRQLDNDGDTPIMAPDGTLVALVALRRDDVKKGEKWHAEDEERDANARLFAAALDLLAACRAAVVERTNIGLDRPFWTPGVMRQLDAAIAAAEPSESP